MITLLVRLSAVIAVLLMGNPAVAVDLPTKGDGWHTWQVDESGVATNMCCFNWSNGKAIRGVCRLDGRNTGYTSDSDCTDLVGTVQIYVKLSNGVASDIRVLSSNCPVSTDGPIIDLGLVSANDNLIWFKSVIENGKFSDDVREEALFGLVQSGGDVAYAYLDRLISAP